MSDLPDILRERGLTVSAAESLTAGLVQSALASKSGSSAYFQGGITVYNLDQKVEHLGVDGTHGLEVNSVSSTVVGQMAHGVRRMFNTDIGLATTGYAEPNPEHGVVRPYAWIGVMIGDNDLYCKKVVFPNRSRSDVRAAVTTALLTFLTKLLLEDSDES